jgi:hypothetical protein
MLAQVAALGLCSAEIGPHAAPTLWAVGRVEWGKLMKWMGRGDGAGVADVIGIGVVGGVM